MNLQGFFASVIPNCTNGSGNSNECLTGLPRADATSANIGNILTIVFGALGVLSVVMIMIGALNFITSEGDPQKAASARHTIIYAVIGLVIAISAEVLVGFVLGGFS